MKSASQGIGGLEELLIQATHACLTQVTPWLLGLGRATPKINIRCDLKGQAAGKVTWRPGEPPLVRYNLDMARHQPEAFVQETVPHEIAHVLCHLLHPRARPHGPEWRVIMQRLGAEPKRCHAFEIPKTASRKRQQRWPYQCHCREHLLSSTRHYRVVRGQSSYQCTSCGETLRQNKSP